MHDCMVYWLEGTLVRGRVQQERALQRLFSAGDLVGVLCLLLLGVWGGGGEMYSRACW